LPTDFSARRFDNLGDTFYTRVVQLAYSPEAIGFPDTSAIQSQLSSADNFIIRNQPTEIIQELQCPIAGLAPLK
jgi:hypothetical protein